jgi:perosamine synthetase
MKIPYAKPSITQLEIDYVNDAVTNGWGDQRNSYLDKFEREFSSHIGSKFAIATSSCTGALHMGLSALGVGIDDEVILADSNWVATVAPVVHLGATPVFVDVLRDTWCIDPSLVKDVITSKTKAIIATHLYGNLAGMTELLEIGEQYGIPVIEDAAEAIGSTYLGQRAGSIGLFSVFSFHGSKTITTGEGGMLVTNDEKLFERVLTLSNHGRDRSEKKLFWPAVVGFKYKMSNVQAALGCAQLSRLETLVAKRKEILASYKSALLQIDGIIMNPDQNGSENGAWMPTVVLNEKKMSSEFIQLYMRQSGIDVRPFFAPLTQTGLFRGQKPGSVSQNLFEGGLNLPSFFDITENEQKKVIDAMHLAVKKYGEK